MRSGRGLSPPARNYTDPGARTASMTRRPTRDAHRDHVTAATTNWSPRARWDAGPRGGPSIQHLGRATPVLVAVTGHDALSAPRPNRRGEYEGDGPVSCKTSVKGQRPAVGVVRPWSLTTIPLGSCIRARCRGPPQSVGVYVGVSLDGPSTGSHCPRRPKMTTQPQDGRRARPPPRATGADAGSLRLDNASSRRSSDPVQPAGRRVRPG